MDTTTEKTVYIGDLHFDHLVWQKELAFFRDEIQVFEHRLEEIAQRWTKRDVLAQLERFQNQYIREKEVIDELMHDITRREQALSDFAKDHPIAIDHVHFADHRDLRERMFTFRKIYFELKHDFHNFLRKYM